MKSAILESVKQAIRNPYAWPGGYPVYTIMADGELLCPTCARNNYVAIAYATKNRDHSSWQAADAQVYWEGPPVECCNCNKPLESAYGDPEQDGEE